MKFSLTLKIQKVTAIQRIIVVINCSMVLVVFGSIAQYDSYRTVITETIKWTTVFHLMNNLVLKNIIESAYRKIAEVADPHWFRWIILILSDG